MHIRREVSAFLRRTNMPDSRFGRLAVNDARFVADLIRGREIKPATEARVRAFMAAHEGDAK